MHEYTRRQFLGVAGILASSALIPAGQNSSEEFSSKEFDMVIEYAMKMWERDKKKSEEDKIGHEEKLYKELCSALEFTCSDNTPWYEMWLVNKRKEGFGIMISVDKDAPKTLLFLYESKYASEDLKVEIYRVSKNGKLAGAAYIEKGRLARKIPITRDVIKNYEDSFEMWLDQAEGLL